MNERNRAIDILKQAREVLLSRLAERVVDGGEDILDDAAGYSYSGAIESLHDQLGQRLGNVTALLAHLQSADEAPASFDVPPAEMSSAVPEIDAVFGVGIEGYSSEAPCAAQRDSIARDSHVPPAHADRGTEPSPPREADWAPGDADADVPIDAEEADEAAEAVGSPIPMASTTKDSGAMTPPVEALVPLLTETAANTGRDRVVQEAVFQEADFRTVDLFAGDFEGALLASGNSQPADESEGT